MCYCSSCIVANLWDVTDRDIDRYLESIIKVSLVDATSNGKILLDSIQSSRVACKLKYLIGAAPVVYGFPIGVKILANPIPE